MHTDDEIKSTLTNAHTIAVVGLSENPERPSFRVARYLKSQGYLIVPINPSCINVMGEKCYADLTQAIPEVKQIDVVDIFSK